MLVVPLASAADPGVPPLSESERARLEAGDVVVQTDLGGERTISTGVVRVRATTDRIWPAVLDFQARIPENASLKRVTEYRRDGPDDWFVAFDMNVFGIKAVVHDHWQCSLGRNVCAWALDPSVASDLVLNEGFMYVEPRAGDALLVFHSELVARMWAPGWIRRWLAEDSMENVLDHIRIRAER
jgi:hypothetical protein